MEEPKITSGTVPYIASEIPDDPRDITPEQWEAMKAVDIRTVDKSQPFTLMNPCLCVKECSVI